MKLRLQWQKPEVLPATRANPALDLSGFMERKFSLWFYTVAYSGGWKALFPWQQSKQRRKDETIWDYTSHWLELISCWLSSRLNTAINNIILTQLSPSNTPEHSATATGSRCTRQVLTLQQCIRVYDTHTHHSLCVLSRASASQCSATRLLQKSFSKHSAVWLQGNVSCRLSRLTALTVTAEHCADMLWDAIRRIFGSCGLQSGGSTNWACPSIKVHARWHWDFL